MFLGTSPRGVDVVGFTSVGVATEAIARGLSLQSGHTYYATVRGKQNTKNYKIQSTNNNQQITYA